jgi:hypothetical protein
LSPTAAVEALEGTPVGWLQDVIEARHYARAKAMFDAANTTEARARLPQSALMDLVKTITFELVQQELSTNG